MLEFEYLFLKIATSFVQINVRNQKIFVIMSLGGEFISIVIVVLRFFLIKLECWFEFVFLFFLLKKIYSFKFGEYTENHTNSTSLKLKIMNL